MDKKEFIYESAIFTLVMIVVGVLFGIILNLVGFTFVSITSWHYWLAYAALYLPMITVIILSRYNIPLGSTFGSAIHMGACCIGGFTLSTYILQKPLDIGQFLLWVTSFIAVFIVLQYILPHASIQTRIQSVKKYFSKK